MCIRDRQDTARLFEKLRLVGRGNVSVPSPDRDVRFLAKGVELSLIHICYAKPRIAALGMGRGEVDGDAREFAGRKDSGEVGGIAGNDQQMCIRDRLVRCHPLQ